MKLCAVEGCSNAAGTGRGMCHKHYKRWQVNGHTGLTSGQGATDPNERLALRGVRTTSGCLEWNGPLNARGYGATKWNYKYFSVHRLAWTLANGPVPDGMFVCHHCDNRKCYEISHLFIGSASDNRRDCVAKGRANVQSGDDHWTRRKLNAGRRQGNI